MCTLSIYNGKKQCVVTMNRDERRNRKEEGILHSRIIDGTRIFFPVDTSSKGTWMGINNRGVVLCLLNRYQAPDVKDAQSRGNIIPAALGKGDFESVCDWLGRLEYQHYNPFDLFLVKRKKIIHFMWDGSDYRSEEITPGNWTMFTSSSLNTEEVIAFRQNLFDAWSHEIGKKLFDNNEILRGFHLIQIEGLETCSVLMEREKSHTKSVCQVIINKNDMGLKYFPDILVNVSLSPLPESVDENIVIRK